MCTIEELCFTREDFEREKRLKFWIVSDNGDIDSNPKEDIGPFHILAQEILRTNWLTHFFGKCFPSDGEQIKEEFYNAYFQALRKAGYKSIELDVDAITIKSATKNE